VGPDPAPVNSSDESRCRTAVELENRPSDRVPSDCAHLLHEMSVHQIDVELQNEALMHRRAEVEAGLTLYTDIHDSAPVAYGACATAALWAGPSSTVCRCAPTTALSPVSTGC